jgi:hypothetical protein
VAAALLPSVSVEVLTPTGKRTEDSMKGWLWLSLLGGLMALEIVASNRVGW